MDTAVVRYGAFFDELSKIAEERPPATKSRLRTLLTTVVPATAIGGGMGYAAGRLINRALRHVPNTVLAKYGPTALGILGGLGGGLALAHRQKVKEALDR